MNDYKALMNIDLTAIEKRGSAQSAIKKMAIRPASIFTMPILWIRYWKIPHSKDFTSH